MVNRFIIPHSAFIIFHVAEPQIEQLFLVPGRTKAETAIWGAAVMEFAVRFPGVFISHDYAEPSARTTTASLSSSRTIGRKNYGR